MRTTPFDATKLEVWCAKGPRARSERVEVDAGSRQHPAFDVRLTVSRRNDANHASQVSVLALRGEN